METEQGLVLRRHAVRRVVYLKFQRCSGSGQLGRSLGEGLPLDAKNYIVPPGANAMTMLANNVLRIDLPLSVTPFLI
ncbi:MAG: hypothetical protein O7I93_10115 [Gemmatimonadetes bacterium]|nr:hypothetical protein [Gemmatimonadota bacterium]